MRLGARHQKIRIILPKPIPNESDRIRLGDAILQEIQIRAMRKYQGYNRKSKRYEKFPSYTKEYAAKKGSGRSEVDLTLKGDMFTDMQVLKDTPKTITVGFIDGSKSNAKADGNIRGTYGKNRGNSSKARPFLGISPQVLNTLVKKIEKNG